MNEHLRKLSPVGLEIFIWKLLYSFSEILPSEGKISEDGPAPLLYLNSPLITKKMSWLQEMGKKATTVFNSVSFFTFQCCTARVPVFIFLPLRQSEILLTLKLNKSMYTFFIGRKRYPNISTLDGIVFFCLFICLYHWLLVLLLHVLYNWIFLLCNFLLSFVLESTKYYEIFTALENGV